MNFPGRIAFLVLAASVGHAQPHPDADDPIIKLPPLIVNESPKSAARPWYYVEGPGFEVLSRCREDTTAEFARGYHRSNVLLQVLVPPELQVKLSSPYALLLYRNDMIRQLPEEMVAEITRLNPVGPSGNFNLKVMPNMALRDPDLDATYSAIDEYIFNRNSMRIAPEAVRQRLETRTPRLPVWFIEGVMRLYGHAHVKADSIDFPAYFWVNRKETNSLATNKEHPRVLLPMAELFKPRRDLADLPPDTLAYPWRHQAALFIRWAYDGHKNRARRDALFKFVMRSSEKPVTEDMFEECFGLNYGDVQDRLSAYLHYAVNHPFTMSAGKMPRLNLHVREATPGEVARIKGEWERLSANHVRLRAPSLVAKYEEQALVTLLRAHDKGERHPDFLTALGLSYCDAGEVKTARPFLEQATLGGTIRVRAYFELARLRYLERLPPEGVKFSPAQIEEVLQPLRSARKLSPPLPDAYELVARVLTQGDRTPTVAELAWVLEGVNLFPLNSSLTYQAAHLHVLHGPKPVANLLIRHGLESSRDDATRTRFENLSAGLALRSN